MTEERSVFGAALAPAHLRSVMDYVGYRVMLHPAQLTSYADFHAVPEQRRLLYEGRIGGLPCFVSPSFPKDQIEFVDKEGGVIFRLTNLAIPSGY